MSATGNCTTLAARIEGCEGWVRLTGSSVVRAL